MRNITKAQHTDHGLVIIDDWQTPDFLPFHQLDRDFDIIVGRATHDIFCHHVFGGHFATVAAISESTTGNVTVSDYSNQLTVGLDRDRANIAVTHTPCDFSYGRTGVNACCTFMHHFLDSHVILLEPIFYCAFCTQAQHYGSGRRIVKLLAEYLEHARQFELLAGETKDDPRVKRMMLTSSGSLSNARGEKSRQASSAETAARCTPSGAPQKSN
jgi:hypothetical protein